MLENYFPILMFIIIALIMGTSLMCIGFLLGKILRHAQADTAKQSPYECGFEAFENARIQFDVRYYLVAILFIIFDLEITFMFPWAVVLTQVGWAGFWAMMLFLGILTIGFIYEWRKGALEWE